MTLNTSLNNIEETANGRVQPYIYAFKTNSIPNYLKVGDTYRSVNIRLNEWKKYYPTLEQVYEAEAKVDDEYYFRDISIHKYLREDLSKIALNANLYPNHYFSKEFFKDVTKEDLNNSIKDIKNNKIINSNKYQYYKVNNGRIPLQHTFPNTLDYPIRTNQQATIDKFKKAVANNRTNLLMYAVMRFGKSFTAICCGLEIDAKLIVIVSAKADVKDEWRNTVQSHIKFKKYQFFDTNTNQSEIEKSEYSVIFLTLQDLQGPSIKSKHKYLFDSTIDLLIIDETHFGARASEYGRAIRNDPRSKPKAIENPKLQEVITIDQLETQVKTLNSKIKLHLSGTPYRILMGSEFEDEDIIAFYQFTDIIDDKQNWDNEHLFKDEVEEWDNPYYGFPEMIRFALNPNDSSKAKLLELKKQNVTYSLNALLEPLSIKKDNDNYYLKFKHSQEVLDLLEVIDGTKTDNELVGFLDIDKMKRTKMLRHIVIVLPYRASCDAMANLLKENNNKFKNLNTYEVINIAGHDTIFKNSLSIKEKIESCEQSDIKTITLTVNRMLTGSTVKEWDTMIFLKDTSSPQEYDQAIFRIQNPYIKVIEDKEGGVIKLNLKPQTVLLDFDAMRLFKMQEQKALIYNINTDSNNNNDQRGNTQLKYRIAKELSISPVLFFNTDCIEKINATVIMDKVREYSRDKSILEEACSIPIDMSLLDNNDFGTIINSLLPIDSKTGIFTSANQDDSPQSNLDTSKSNTNDTDSLDSTESSPKPNDDIKDDKVDITKKFATYYTKILFFAYLTSTSVNSLDDIINTIPDSEENSRIAKNLNLDIISLMYLQANFNHNALHILDYKIANINSLSLDTTIKPIDRLEIAIKKFGRLSSSEIATPSNIVNEIIGNLDLSTLKGKKILDIATKQGEFAIGLVKAYLKAGREIDFEIYSIPTSSIAYEFTKKVYDILGLDTNNIEKNYTSYHLIKDKSKYITNQTILINNTPMTIDIIIGNPPYQTTTVKTSDTPIYHKFMELAFDLAQIVIMITLSRFIFNAGKTPKSFNHRVLNDPHFKVCHYYPKASEAFPNVDIKGGVVITMRNMEEEYGPIVNFIPNSELLTILNKVQMINSDSISTIIYSPESYKFTQQLHSDYPNVKSILSEGHELDLTTNIFVKLDDAILSDICPNPKKKYLLIHGITKKSRINKFIKREYIRPHPNLDKFKVLVTKVNGSGFIGEVISTPLIGKPGTGHTQSFISIGALDTVDQAQALLKYIKTKFVRALLGLKKVTPDNKKATWQHIPLQDFTSNSDVDWSLDIPSIDQQLYTKYNLNKSEIDFIENNIQPME
ncbi:MAG: Eco57I restriction-modification methylase domain-containing protein [Patescibacteria group bacterium]